MMMMMIVKLAVQIRMENKHLGGVDEGAGGSTLTLFCFRGMKCSLFKVIQTTIIPPSV